jgi:D-alanyl-D-alanine carboxypeptidase/D-alanyl-D-alanine-endopeptidase (penicillin-binding protein 4)
MDVWPAFHAGANPVHPTGAVGASCGRCGTAVRFLQLRVLPALLPLLWLAGVAHAQTAAGPPGPQALPPAVRAALQAAQLPDDALAAVALPLGHDAPAWGWRDQVAMQPGSTMKLVTSIVALDRLGTGLRGSTELRTAAPVRNGVLLGNLVLKGGADPDLNLPELWALLLDLRQQGVREIHGDLLFDRSLFRPPRMDLGLPPFDESPEFPYNVIPDALQLNGNLLPLVLTADGASVRASTLLPLDGLSVVSQMSLNDRACDDWDADWLPATVRTSGARGQVTRIELHGAFPRNCSQHAWLQLIDRRELGERLFRSLWRSLGGRWAGRAYDAVTPPGTRLLAEHRARPWGELLRPMNKQSDNVLARLLFLDLGVPGMADDPLSSTADLAARSVRAWLAEHHIDASGLVLDNGSGLSRSERITPLQLASMLAVAWAGPHAPDLLMSLPVAGVDGTLRKHLQDSPAAGWARLKTGSLRNAQALAGVLRDAQGRPWAVAMMINHEPLGTARAVLDALVDCMARSAPGAWDGCPAPGPSR